jgi:AsmA protein
MTGPGCAYLPKYDERQENMMKKVLAILGITLGAIVLLVVAGILLLLLLVDPNDYKEEIARAVHDATGRELTFEGDISFTFYPWLGLELGPVALSNAQGFTRDVFARVAGAKVNVRLIPLLRREVEVDSILLDGLALHLEKDAAGQTNWEDLVREVEEEPAPVREEPAIRDLSIGGITVRNALVTWDDRSAEQTFELRNVDLSTSEVRFGELFRFSLGFDFLSTAPQLASRTEIAGRAMLDPGAERYAARPLEIQSTLKGEQIPGQTMTLNLTTSMDADLKAGTVTLSEISLNALGQLQAHGEMHVSDVTTEPAYRGSLMLLRFNPRELMRAMGIDPPQSSDPNALTSLAAEASFSGTAESATIDTLLLVLDQTTLKGTAAVPSFEPQAYRFDLNVDAIDLDRYLPPQVEEAPADPVAAPPAEDGDPLEGVRDLRLSGQMVVGRLKLMNLTTSDVRIGVQARDGLLTVDPLRMDLYGGTASGRIRMDARKPLPTWSASEKLTSVQIGPLLQDFMNQELISGTANLDIELSGAGLDADRIKQALDGRSASVSATGRSEASMWPGSSATPEPS